MKFKADPPSTATLHTPVITAFAEEGGNYTDIPRVEERCLRLSALCPSFSKKCQPLSVLALPLPKDILA